ncbi:unnamed protein product [Ceratitis capitata]|uniref:(Mediterranean fruit fly) hypothetical protein n=1 Tax=Ceratitis capitata TaxID=7213 RepID=A0A811U7H2_CERCA|nr:unnamed protein product [Ceratitis capitata]
MLLKKLAIWQFVLVFAAFMPKLMECKSFFGIGMRILNDELLLKDVLQAPPVRSDENPVVGFNYAIPQPITYIEIVSDQNVLADVNFSYQDDLVKGNITAIDDDNTTTDILEPFQVEILIYGFKETVLNVDSSYILNRDQQFQGILEPTNDEFDEDWDEFEGEDTTNTSEEIVVDSEEDMDYKDNFGEPDKIIELGARQAGDYLLYETYQTSLKNEEEASTHNVTFYYIDSNFITYVRFIIFDHTEDNEPPEVEYTHFSPNSLKATITDANTTNLFVQMLMYGYTKEDLPFDYEPFLTSRLNIPTESPLERLKALMNSKIRKTFDDPEEINFETGEKNSLPNNSSTTDASTRNFLNEYTVFNIFIIYLLTNFNLFI